ncbi:MAG: bifunctional (p)ppGpp synthetase/guanosine-3',5'-bis(diphosphate) 3'-pyrophosphohydrolase [Synergistales bacterium]|nr:bifunctional (p)ppGpp synthetase/guanosine-3',5'-bis(diphosphate) 3'-pyrophosphohydrolase [Synergistales bacterium]
MGRVPAQQRVASLKLVWQELWSKAVQYMDSGELAELGEAFVFAADAHDGQWRSSGDPYTTHTISVTTILAEMQLEREVLLAAILHDILEDTAVPKERLAEKFGDHVAVLVDGVTKLGKLPFKSIEDYQAENLRKMFIVMAKDIRVVLIKLADRVHNMRTLQSLRRDKQLRIAKETLEIYAPLAHRLGIYQIKRELEDLAFKIQDPDMYYEIRRRVRKKLPEREAVVKDAINALQERVKSSDIDIYITGRAKHFFSIFEKMQRKNLSLEQVYDLLAVRVIVSTITECYTVLGTVHTLWKPIPGQFDDYIANPKNNMYQSLHTTVVGPSGEPLEVQIRTWEMHQIAEYGIAAHWQYKEKRNKTDELDQRLTWVRQALEEQSDAEEPSSFLEHLKEDVLTSEVFVFTPQGDVVNLPNGSTPIDFAYSIHTEVGHKCVGAMVNGRIVSMDYTLQNGDIVRVLTSPQGHPSRDWLKVVRSNRARSKIRSYFRQKERAERERRVSRGRELIDRELRKKGYEGSGAVEDYKGQMNRAARDYGFAHADELLAEIGSGNRNPEAVASKVVQKSRKPAQPEELPETRTPEHKREFDSEIAVEGDEGVLVSIANCCRPVPGDPIVGYVTKNRGITVHHVHCGNIKNAARDRLVNVSWGNRVAHSYPARINVEAGDRPTLFADISQAINAAEASIVGVRASVKGANRAVMTAEIQVRDLEHLYHVIAKVNAVPGVMQVVRG